MPKAPVHRGRACQASLRKANMSILPANSAAAKIKITEQSENVYENKGSMPVGMRLNRECL